MLYMIIVLGSALCAFMAIRARQLIESALWLAGTSVLVSICLYALGAETAAMIELSVGAGLVTVLFVFAISIAGDDAVKAKAFMSSKLALGLALGFVLLLGWMVLPLDTVSSVITGEASFSTVVWDDRVLDILLQLVLIFAGVLGLLGLLADEKSAQSDIARHKKVPVTKIVGGSHKSFDPTSVHTVPANGKSHEREPEKENILS